MEPSDDLAHKLNQVIEGNADSDHEVKAYVRPESGDPTEGVAGFGSSGYYPGDVWPRTTDGIAAPAGETHQPVSSPDQPDPLGNPVARDFRQEEHDAAEMRPVSEEPATPLLTGS